jgi:hypothetical protein
MKLDKTNCRLRFLRNCLQLLLLVVTVPGALPSGQAASESATVSAKIVVAITLTNRNGMVFGDISAGNTAGTVVLDPSGTRETTGGANVNSTVASVPAVFDVEGLSNAIYSITLPDAVTLSGPGGDNMVVDSFASFPQGTGLTDIGGQQSLFVGATLHVDGNQAFGSYTGTMSVTIEYN